MVLDRAGYVDFSCARGCTATQLQRLIARYRFLRTQRGLSMRQAHTRLAREWHRTAKRIEALLSDARRYECIRETWEDYCAHQPDSDDRAMSP
jgi:hypothetical protein